MRVALFLLVAWVLLAYIGKAPSSLVTALIVSLIGCTAPIRWRKRYGRARLQHTEFTQAQKEMKVELYLRIGATLLMGMAVLAYMWRR
jgi:hypothetical protein